MMPEPEMGQEFLLKQRAHINRIAEEVRKAQQEIDVRRMQEPRDETENEAPFH